MKKSKWFLPTPTASYKEIDEIMARLSTASKNDLFQFCDVNNVVYATGWPVSFLLDVINDTLLSRLVL